MGKNLTMSRRGFLGVAGGAAAVAAVGLAGCGSSSSGDAASSSDASTASSSGDTVHIKWAKDNSGNFFKEIAQSKGWWQEAGIEIEDAPFESDNDAITALAGGKVDVISNYGTNGPLQSIASGSPIQIVGGYMATGCMPIFTRKENDDYKDVTSFVGKTVAENASDYTISGTLLDLGYDPKNDVNWVSYDNYSDMVAAIIQGEADYGVAGTSRNYEISQQPDLKVVAYRSDIMPWYSCCRMCVSTDFMNNNPDTLKTIISVLLRGQAFYEASDANKQETKEIMEGVLNVDEDYLNSFMDNEHFRISVDPLTHEVTKAWDILGNTGFLADGWDSMNIADYIQKDVYKQALDMSQENYGDEYPEFYSKMQDFYTEHNA